jgi:hypothetical protein
VVGENFEPIGAFWMKFCMAMMKLKLTSTPYQLIQQLQLFQNGGRLSF